jgi:hypothetical protein
VDKTVSGQKVDRIAVVAVHKQAAVGKVDRPPVVHTAAAPAVDSTEPVGLVLAAEIVGTATGDMETEAAGLVVAEEVYYIPTALEDMVMMSRKRLGSAVV